MLEMRDIRSLGLKKKYDKKEVRRRGILYGTSDTSPNFYAFSVSKQSPEEVAVVI